MKNFRLEQARFVVGLVLVVIAVLMFLFKDYTTAGAIPIGVLGLISIGTSRER